MSKYTLELNQIINDLDFNLFDFEYNLYDNELKSDFEKKERLLVDEVNSNNDYININVDIMYSNKKSACEEFNKKFGLNVKVVKNNNFENSYDQDGEKEDNLNE